MKRLVLLIAVGLLILFILGLLSWFCLQYLGPPVVEDNEGVWRIPSQGLEIKEDSRGVWTGQGPGVQVIYILNAPS